MKTFFNKEVYMKGICSHTKFFFSYDKNIEATFFFFFFPFLPLGLTPYSPSLSFSLTQHLSILALSPSPPRFHSLSPTHRCIFSLSMSSHSVSSQLMSSLAQLVFSLSLPRLFDHFLSLCRAFSPSPCLSPPGGQAWCCSFQS